MFMRIEAIRHLNMLAAENRPSDISIGSQVSHSSRGKEAEFAFFAISFWTFNKKTINLTNSPKIRS